MATSKTEKATTETKAKSKPDHPKYMYDIFFIKKIFNYLIIILFNIFLFFQKKLLYYRYMK